jgi:hypothetical protein
MLLLMIKNTALAKETAKAIVTGYRGSGITTELYRLMHDIEYESFVIIFCSAIKDLNPIIRNLHLTDLLFMVVWKTLELIDNRDLELDKTIVLRLLFVFYKFYQKNRSWFLKHVVIRYCRSQSKILYLD